MRTLFRMASPPAAAITLALALGQPAAAMAQTPDTTSTAPVGAAGDTTFLFENLTRAELWRYFQPPPTGAAQPDYAFIGNRSTLGASYRGTRWAMQGALQYVRLEHLPARAIGPGLLGTGASYYFHAAGTFSYQFYLRGLSLTWRDGRRGLWGEVGRFSRAAATERPTGDSGLDRLVADEVNGRLLGDMEWSLYQRAWDGVRGGLERSDLAITMTAAVPTQGTYEESANLPMDRVRVGAAEVSFGPGRLLKGTRVDAFASVYDDTRRVSARPDNSLAAATAADIRVATAGASAAGAYASPWGRADLVAWLAGQWGDWYELTHRGVAATASAGHRWTRAPGQPWLRAGLAYASGDGDPADDRHATFFPLLPSGDRVSRLNAYAQMNVVDRWLSVEVTPVRALTAYAAVRRVGLATAADRWYQGSGATVRGGNYFGYQGRLSRGATALGTVVEAGATWQPRRWWTLSGYVGRIAGGDVVERTFRDPRLVTGWIESTIRF